jgi:hypothetical protein
MAGRPTKYRPEYCDEIVKFFDVEPYEYKEVVITLRNGGTLEKVERHPARLPTMERFASDIGVNGDTLVEWSKRHRAFSAAYARAKALQKDILITNGLQGLYNGPFAIFVAKNATDMEDKTEQDHTGVLNVIYRPQKLPKNFDGLDER